MLNPLASGLLLAAATNSMPARAISRSAVSVSEVLWGLLMDAMQLEHGAVSSNAQQYQYGAHARTHTHQSTDALKCIQLVVEGSSFTDL